MDMFIHLFSGLGSFFVQDPSIAFARIFLIIFGAILAYAGFTKKLEPLIMVPMGFGMIAVNSGVLFLDTGTLGTLFLDPLIDDPNKLVEMMQVNVLQPVYNLTFSNGLIACIIFFGIGCMSDISFILIRPWACIIVALFAELGTFVTLILGVELFNLPLTQAASIATIGGADGPMVLFASLILSPELFVPISIIAYLYLSLTYAGYPYLIKLMIPKKYRGVEVNYEFPKASSKAKFIFIVLVCTVLCLLLPVASPLILSFFLGVAIKEAKITPYVELLEKTLLYTSTLFMGLLLGTLCEASTILNPTVAIILVLGITALAVSGVGAIAGGWFIYWISKKNFNPVIGIAGVSCLPTTAKIAQKTVSEANPYSVIMPLALGASVSGLIVSAIATGVFISTLILVK